MANLNSAKLNTVSLNKSVLDALSSDSSDRTTVSNALNATLKTVLTTSAANTQQTTLANLLETLSAADIGADQNLSLRDFVAQNVTLPTDPAAKQAAQAAIATLSSTTMVGALLGLNNTVASNPIFSGVVAQTNLSSLLATSSALSTEKIQTDFITKYASFQGAAQDFWTQLSQDADFKTLVPELQFTMQLGVLTLNNPALVTALRSTYKPTTARDLTKLGSSALTQLITSQNIPIPDDIQGSTAAEKTTNYVNGIIALLQSAFSTDYVAQGLAASKDTTQQTVARFLTNSPDFDFQTTSVDSYIQQNSTKAFQGIDQTQVSPITAQLKSIQRLFRISPNYSTINTLLLTGLDSASKISALSRTNFITQYSSALGGDSQALMAYTTAAHINAQALNLYRTIHTGLKDISPRAIADPNSSVQQAIESGVPNWETLFGSTSYCECEDCVSVYSAAAYFVDLLQFLRNSKPNAANFTPLDVLIGGAKDNVVINGRRPDLPFIKLNCQDTNTPLPYIDLINEILESYIVLGGKLDKSTAHSNPTDATAAELSVNPEYTLEAAYAPISTASYPLTLPYDRFLDVARRYLAFLGGDRLQVIQSFQTQQAPVGTASIFAAEVLGLSYQEFQLIAAWDYLANKAATLPSPYGLYGYSAASVTQTIDGTSTTKPWEQWIAGVPEFMARTGLGFEDVVNLLKTQFINPGQSILLSNGASPCDVMQTLIAPLTDATLTNILPFIRLWTKLGWSMSDLDKVIAVLAPSGITRGFLLALAQLQQLKSSLNLELNQILSLWGNIDTDGRRSLYGSLFQNKSVLNPVDVNLHLAYRAALSTAPTSLPASSSAQITYDATNQQMLFAGAMTDDQWTDLITWAGSDAAKLIAVQNLYQMRWAKGTELALVTSSTPPTITGEMPALLAALRISSDDLNAIRTAAGLLDTSTPVPLNLANVSQLYRYAILAQSLGVSISDLISLIVLTGINPFQLSSTDDITGQTVRFVQGARTVLASRFSVAQLNFIYRALSNPAMGVGPLEVDIDLLVQTLQTGLQQIIATNAFSPDPNGKLLRQKLGVILAATDLSAAMDLISGSATYTASLAALPSGVSFTGTLANLIAYDSSNQLLECNGPMSDGVKALLALSSDTAYQAAVNQLYQQPRDILANDLAFLNPADALTQLINSPSPNVADRYSYVLQVLLTYLTNVQSRDLVKQSLSQTLALDAATTSLLLTDSTGPASPALLNSQRDSSQPAIVDFLDVSNGGLLATYFSDTSLTNVTRTQIDSSVNAGSGAETVTNPGGARWSGKVLAQFSETYTFYVSGNDGVRLWVNNQLLIDQWSNQASSTRTSSPIALIAGQMYDIRLDYYNASATASAVLGWSSKSTSDNVNIPVVQSALFPANIFATLFRLYPIGLLLSTFGMKADEVAYLSANGADFIGTDPNNSANTVNFDLTKLPVDRSNDGAVDKQCVAFFDQWLHLNDLFMLRNTLSSGNVSLFDIFRAASSSTNPAALGANTVTTVLAATGWDNREFATLTGKATVGSAIVGFGLTDADFRNVVGQKGTGLVWLKNCLDLSGRLGISTDQLFLWANNPPDASQARDIKNTVKAKYNDPTWVTVGKPLNDTIREDSKTALIAFVLNMSSIVALGYTNADELYEYFLIDVQMSSCMLTSRIVQATAAVQLFIQRCLLNLENDYTGANANLNVSPAAIDADQWQWRQNYRVWEANREVFLYPENWIDPTLRDNRTPFFQDLQNELQQGEITAERAEQAFQNYLKKVQEVARLEICGLYWEYDVDASASITHNVFHVFGRTYNSPHSYYYRTFDNTANLWSPWQAVAADIEGDHLIPVIWNRRLHIFWPIFKEQTTPNTATGSSGITVPPISVGGSGTVAQPTLPLKDLEVQMAWSEYRDGGWTKKQLTSNSLTPAGYSGYTADFDPSTLLFKAVPYEDQLTIFAYEKYGNPIGAFTFGSCSSLPATSNNIAVPPIGSVHYPANTMVSDQSLQATILWGVASGSIIPFPLPINLLILCSGNPDKPGPISDTLVLNSTPSQFALMYPQQFFPTWEIQAPSSITGGVSGQPFFYADDVRTYFVIPKPSRSPLFLRNLVNSFVVYNPAQLQSSANISDLAKLPIFEETIVPTPAAPSTNRPATIRDIQPSVSLSRSSALGLAAVAASSGTDPIAAVGASQAVASVPAEITVDQKQTTEITAILAPWKKIVFNNNPTIDFFTHRHPHLCDFLKALNWQDVPGLLTLANQELDAGDVDPNTIFQKAYAPTNVVAHPYPSEDVDFSSSGAYSIYNWEIFFHIPFLIATQLSQNQQFDDAEKWFRYIFNPTSNSTDPIPSRYWNVLPFHQDTEPERIGDLVTALQYAGSDPALLKEKADFSAEISQWEHTPFDPDLIARLRIVAYQKAVVMKYLDHHFSWGDQLYAQFTRESVNEATLHYVLCQELLGDKPVTVPPQGVVLDRTYYDLVSMAPGLDAFSDVLVTMENLFPFSTDSASSNSDNSESSGASSIASVPYFCIPPNDTLLGYWDKVAQRLFQIRHCMNISGQVQQSPLFAPPINPGLLIQAFAMGMDLSSALGDINAATPYYRFAYMLPKALELCSEVRSLGAALLSALEKSDAEALSMLRATQETSVLKAVRNVRQQQLNEANSNLAALNDAQQVTTARQTYYQGLITAGLTQNEMQQISQLTQAQAYQTDAQNDETQVGQFAMLPNMEVGANGAGGSPIASVSFGSQQFVAKNSSDSRLSSLQSSYYSTSATMMGLQATWDRRSQDWAFQLQTATLELTQIGDQIKAATARQAFAQADLDNQDLLISNASDVEEFLRTKYTNQALYDWMVSQVSSVYFQCYQMAYGLAKRAEACFVFERMPDPSNYSPFIQFGYWDSLKKGLLSGERLYQDLKRLEIAYMDRNQRDFEITKSVSLLLLDPVALINLKEAGQCTVQLPEAFFDMDYPGHYLRRIKSLSLTIPCVVGPYTSVNCTLTLVNNKIRIDNTAADSKDYVKDSHFVANFAASQSIATSSAQNDSGLFTVNFNDERYLPFEGAGAISTWQLFMPQDTNAFDFETISDVIFNLKYTARDGGDSLRATARGAAILPAGALVAASPTASITLPGQAALTRLFSLRHEFPTEWYNFLNPLASSPDLSMTLNLSQERFPFRYRGKNIQLYEVDLYLIFRNIYDPITYAADGTPLGDYLAKGASGSLTVNVTPPGGAAKTTQLVSNNALLQKIPYGTIPHPAPPPAPPVPPTLGALGKWTLVAKGADIQNIASSLQIQATSGSTAFYRVKPNVVEDIFLVCRFSTT